MKKKAIGVCGSRLFNQIPMSFINTLREAAAPQGYHIVAFSGTIDMEMMSGEEQLFELTQYVDCSALIILTETLCENISLAQRIVEIGKNKKIPVFSVDGVVEGCFNLTMGYHDGFEQVVRHIIQDHHCTKVNMIAGFENHVLSQERIEAYKKVLRENGLPFEKDRLAYGDFWDRPTRKYMEEFLDSGKEMPEAFICANDAMAVTVCSVLNARGYEVPEDVIVTGFDGTQDAKYHFPVLTTCEPDYREAVLFILQKMQEIGEEGDICPCNHEIVFRLAKKQSCGCEPKELHDVNKIVSSLAYDLGDCGWHNLTMNNMVTSLLDKTEIKEVIEKLPEFVKMWSDNFRFACLRSDLVKTGKRSLGNTEMETVLWCNQGQFQDPGEKFPISAFVPHLDEMFEKNQHMDTLVVRLLNSGKRVYGYTVEGFEKLNDRRLQRSNEFAMFLTVCIDTVLHNHKMAELNENLSEAYQKISTLYILDPLTKLYNRRGFFQKLQEETTDEQNMGKYLYVISFDMDGLKKINDTYGHAEGDFAIQTLAKAIRKTLGEEAICARFGGDEFTGAVLTERSDCYCDINLADVLAKNIAFLDGVLEKPYPIGASVGMVYDRVEKNMDTEAMLLAADRLMYADKVAKGKERR